MEMKGEAVQWRLQHEADLDLTASDYLSRAELQQLDRFAVERRRRDWLLGRFTAKSLVRDHLRAAHGQVVPLFEVSIMGGADGAPWARVEGPGSRRRLSLSISHRAGWSLCAICPRPAVPLGADVEQVEPRSPRFVRDYFTEHEHRQVRASGAARDETVTTLWSAKEACLKALHLGLTVDTRRVECDLRRAPASSWNLFLARYTAEGTEGRAPALLRGWWRRQGPLVLTVAVTCTTPDPLPFGS